MMRSKIIFIFRCVVLAGFVLILVNPVRGHVQLDSPNGGEILEVGSIFTITSSCGWTRSAKLGPVVFNRRRNELGPY